MEYLLDTQIFIWAMQGDKRLSKSLKDIISDSKNKIFISVVSVWEIVIKKRKGLKVPKDISGAIEKANLTLLPIEVKHVLEVEKLADFHKDPFDRILMAQALVEDLTLITSDQKIWKYNLKLIKA